MKPELAKKLDAKGLEQYRKLKSISVNAISNFSCVVINAPIGSLSKKDAYRTVYVLGSSLIQARKTFDELTKKFIDRETKVKDLIKQTEESVSDKYTRDEVEELLKSILVEEESKTPEPGKSV